MAAPIPSVKRAGSESRNESRPEVTLRIALSIVPFGIEENSRQIGRIDIWNLGRNADQTSNYAVVQLKQESLFEDALTLADAKGLVTFDWHGMITDVADWDDQDVKIVHVIGHDRKTRDATDLLYRALLELGYAERNPCPKVRQTKEPQIRKPR
jgi:hypothetical protein